MKKPRLRPYVFGRDVAATAPVLIAAVLALVFAGSARAQAYPERTVRIIVGFAPGGSSDIVARLVAQHLAPLLRQSILVENKPGAGGMIGTDFVAKAASDGHTLLLHTPGHATQAAMMKKLPFDPLDGFAWISFVTRYPIIVATSTQSPVQSLADLVARARNAPGKMTYASTGVGAGQHFLGEWFASETGIELLHVPLKGGTAPLTEVVSGRVDVMFETATVTLPQVRSGNLRALAVTGERPLASLPDVPTVAQLVPGYVWQSRLGIAAPAGTSAEIVGRLNRDIRRVLLDPTVQKRLAELGGEAAPTSPEEMRAQVRAEIERWRKIVQTRGIEQQ